MTSSKVKAKSETDGQKPINLALQGGGSQGAFTWGVLDQLLLDERVYIESISATSAGAMNAAVVAYGLTKGGREEARRLLRDFWRKVSVASSLLPFKATFFDRMVNGFDMSYSPPFMAMDALTRMFSPYQLNVMDLNPLREILHEIVDFEVLRGCDKLKLFVNATHVRSGKIRVFETRELTLDMVMASACLPFIFKTVWVDGEPYWDGGYSGNPAIYPLIYGATSHDVVIVQINPLNVEEVPTNANEILDRINEISFNATLIREMRAIAFVSKLKNQGRLDEDYKKMHMHMIESQEILGNLGRMSKMNADWDFLQYLYEAGVQAAQDWLDKNYKDLGKKSTIDIGEIYL